MPEPNHTPTPAEIQRECSRIRTGWSAAEEVKRRGYRPVVTPTFGLRRGPHGLRLDAGVAPPDILPAERTAQDG